MPATVVSSFFLSQVTTKKKTSLLPRQTPVLGKADASGWSVNLPYAVYTQVRSGIGLFRPHAFIRFWLVWHFWQVPFARPVATPSNVYSLASTWLNPP